ncbi:MAG: histidine kinase [Pricia sp.]
MKTIHKKEVLFWILQFSGWFLVSTLMFIIPGLSNSYALYSFAIGGFIGILTTSIYRFYLKNNVDTEIFGRGSIIKLVTGFVATSAFYYFLEALSEVLYENIWTRTDFEIQYLEENSGFYFTMFDVMVSILIWTIIYFVIKFILEANQNHLRSLELNAALREAQLNTLKGQVNPHFMFNSLNNIRGLMLEDVEKSRSMMTKLSEMLEYAFEKNKIDAIPLKEEVEMVDNYIALSKIQMEERLRFEKDIDPDVLNVSIPPMIVQLLVENAAKHGISNLKDGGMIRLKVNKGHEELHIWVANTGTLQIAEGSTQLGLKNIRQRLRLLYRNEATFSLEEVSGEVVASIKIPLS